LQQADRQLGEAVPISPRPRAIGTRQEIVPGGVTPDIGEEIWETEDHRPARSDSPFARGNARRNGNEESRPPAFHG
jgi:hypothetical protein